MYLGKDRRAPYDEITGLPYCIAPPEELLRPNDPNNNWHHPHHSEAYLLSQGELGHGVRTSRLQLVRNTDHNFGPHTYHTRYDRSKVPQSDIGRVRIILFGVANAVTSRVLDVKNGGERLITEEERQRLFVSGELCMQSDFVVRRVLTRFAVARGIDHLRRDEVMKYRDSRWEDDKKSMANEFIGRFLPIAFEPVNERYGDALHARLLPEAAPPSPAELARPLVFSEPERFKIFNEAFFQHVEQRYAA